MFHVEDKETESLRLDLKYAIFKNNASPHTDHSPLSLTLSHTEQTHSHALTHRLTLTLIQVTHSLHSHALTHCSLTLNLHCQSPLFHNHRLRQKIWSSHSKLWVPLVYVVFQTKKKGELLCTKFTIWLPRDMLEKSKKLWFHEVLSILVSVLNS